MSDQILIDLERQERKPLEPGAYTLIPLDVVLHQATSTSIRVVFFVPESDGFLSDFFGISDKARWKLDQFLDVLAAPAEGKVSVEQLKGWVMEKQFTVELIVEDYNGRKVNKIRKYLDVKPLTEADKALQRSMKERWTQITTREDRVIPAENVLVETQSNVIEGILKQLGG